jgi:hypothetical protein
MPDHQHLEQHRRARKIEIEHAIRIRSCLYCGQPTVYELKEIEEPVWMDGNGVDGVEVAEGGEASVVLVRVQAAVCRICGLAMFDMAADALMNAARKHLERGDVAGWQAVGTVYRVP